MDWMLMPLKRYADFNGRSCRKEYWMFYLFVILIYVALIIFGGLIGAGASSAGNSSAMGIFGGIFGILLMIFVLGILIPSVAVGVRRLHDIDKSGWFYLIALIPFGSIVLLVWFCQRGTEGPNRFGDDPLGAARLGDVFS